MSKGTIRLTTAQALVRFLTQQFIEIDGNLHPLFAGVFGIFGHGNVTCLAEALYSHRDELPTWRGQNEQSMALAAIAFAKAKRRRQIMVATSSIGPGATNMVTAAALAHANRLPVLILSGDVFVNRRPDPVLQQIETFNDPTVSVNDSFRPVSRYWDRITHPEQIIGSLPQAVATMLDPATCGPAFIGLCQDTQEVAYDYPEAFFAPVTHRIPQPRADVRALQDAADLIKTAKKPLIISGGGTRYSGAEDALAKFAIAKGIPVVETIAGKGALVHDHPVHAGPLGVIGSSSANQLAAEADVIIAIGTRLQDFATGSWTVFSHDAKFIAINASRWDAHKHRALAVVGDALMTLLDLDKLLQSWHVDNSWLSLGKSRFADWNALLDDHQRPTNTDTPSYAQVVGLVNEKAGDKDTIVTAAGGLPGEAAKGWRVRTPHTFDCEFGFSCMGYEIAGGWGHALAAKKGSTPIVLVGDGSYMMMNSDIWSTVLTGHKIIVIVCDNGGYAVINRLQNAKGNASFNNLIKDCKIDVPVDVDFAKHAEAMGALGRSVSSLSDLADALDWAKTTDRTTVISIRTDAHIWTPGDADWDVGVPEVSSRENVRAAHKAQGVIRSKQRVGV